MVDQVVSSGSFHVRNVLDATLANFERCFNATYGQA